MNKLSRGERIFEVFNYALLTLLALIFITPLLFVVSSSLVSEAEQVRRGTFVLFPARPDFGAYQLLLQSRTLLTAYGNTLFRLIAGVTLNLLFTATMAYVLSKRGVPGRKWLTLFVFIPMVFSGGIIPLFLTVQEVGLRDSVWAMVIPSLINPFWLLIMRNFFMTIPDELEDAATIDGASPLTILFRIVLPLSLPILATMGLFYAVFHWNAWFDAAIFIDDPDKQPVQLLLRNVLQSGTFQEPIAGAVDVRPPTTALRAALTVITALPILCVYPFLQRYFVKGVLIGSVKG